VSALPLALTVASFAFAVVALAPLAYLALLTLLSWPKRAPARAPDLRLVAVIPAHNEEDGIASTVRSLLDAEYAPEKRSVLVVADNCAEGDRTAERARAAGAEVLVRTNAELRGKGYALELAFTHVLADAAVDGVIVVDADTVASPNLWRSLSDHLSAGAGAVQAANRVRNRDAGRRTRLLAIALAMINGVRCLGRERLSLSAGLKGNGMAFSRKTLETQPYKAYGLVEDVEHAVALGLGGVRVHFAAESYVASESPESSQAAVSQRRRWEGGRIALLREFVPRLLASLARRPRAVTADLLLELLIPPLSYPALLIALGVLLEGAHVVVTDAHTPSPAWPLWALAMGALFVHVARGWQLSGTGANGLWALASAPAYIAWKLVVARPFGRAQSWVRTTRVAEENADKPHA
jgi:cellulose synthase/poly-beta-1,6-N-acetylglucosamine synthase-like glycosyltransferase